MQFRKITAIIHPYRLEDVEEKLLSMNVLDAFISKIKGYGEYANFFNFDWLADHIKVEVFIGKHRAEEIAKAIMEVAHSGSKVLALLLSNPLKQFIILEQKKGVFMMHVIN